MGKKSSYIISFLIILLINHNTIASKSEIEDQRELFLRVEASLKKNRNGLYRKYNNRLKKYPLFPYLQYIYYRNNISSISSKDIKSFVNKYKNSPLADKLKNYWLFEQAQNGKWKDFLSIYEYSDNIKLQCHYINAHYQTYSDPKILEYAKKVWLKGESQPTACNPVFKAWETAGLLSNSLIWRRIKYAMQAQNHQLARYLAKKLKDNENNLVELWIRTDNNPDLIKKQHYFASNHPAIIEIIVHGLEKVAREKPTEGIKIWKSLSKKYQFNEKHWGRIVRSISFALASDQHPETIKWLDSIPPELANTHVYNVRLSIMLKNQQWKEYLSMYEKMPEQYQQQEKWRYWYAVSLGKTGQATKSNKVLETVASHRNYYGFISSLRLLKPYNFNNQEIKYKLKELEKTAQNPGILRAYELYKLNRVHLATTEWRFSLEIMSSEERKLAAKLASFWELPNWPIVALANTEDNHDLSLRFPKSFSENIFKEAKRNKIDPAIIFAIARIESAFVPTAKSPAGALGLMQLMPSTAKLVSKHTKTKIKSTYDILHTENNIKLGSKYLRMILDRFDNNFVLATAAYNAGPERIKRWMPEHHMSADSWIETIPFKETRNYVQNVLTYTMIYQQLLGNNPNLADYMPEIGNK